MPAVAPLLVSLAVSVAISVGMRLISSLLSQNSNQQQYGGALPRAQDPGTQLTLRQAAAPQQIVYGTRRVAGTVVFAHTTQNNYLLHLVVAWAGHEIDSYGALYFGDEEVPLSGGIGQGKFYGLVGCDDNLGADDQSAFGNLIHHAPELWTAAHRGRGIACSYITVHWNRTLFGSFDHSKIWRVINGKKVYDPRTDETVFSHNAALIVADWMNSAKFGRGIPYDEFLADELEASANVCDEEVDLADGGTEARYACDAVLTSDTPFVDNVNKLLSAMRGEVYQLGGAWAIQAAYWEAPTLVFDEGDFREPLTITSGIGREGFNAIKGKFANPAKNYQLDDFPAILVPSYEIEDGGDGAGLGRVFSDVHLECTRSITMAQRLARIDLRAHRQPIAFTAKLKLKALKAATGKNVAFNIALLGWEEKAFKVKRLRYVPGFGVDGQPGIIGVDLDVIETGEFVFDRLAADEQQRDPIPDTTLPDPSNVLPPSNLRVTESLYSTRDGGGVKAKVTLAFDASPDAFVADGGHYIVEYKLVSDSAWTKLPRVEDGATSIEILDIDPGIYDFRVWALWGNGARSAMPVLLRQSIAGLAAPPAAPTGFTVAAENGVAIAHWNVSADLDVREGGSILFKHSPLATGAIWADAFEISGLLPGNAGQAVLPLKAGTYLAKFKDASGVWSESFASFYQDQASVFDFVSIGSVIEDPEFAGTKTGVAVLDGGLQIDDSGDFDSVPDVDAMPNFDYAEGVAASGNYLFSAPLDLITQQRFRLTALLDGLTIDVYDDFDSRAGEMDDWPDFDGAVAGAETTARLMVRTTNDDPSGSPTWSEWEWLHASDFNKRAVQARLDLTSNDNTYTPRITQLGIVAAAV